LDFSFRDLAAFPISNIHLIKEFLKALSKENPIELKPEKAVSYQLFFSDKFPFGACSNFGRHSLFRVEHFWGLKSGKKFKKPATQTPEPRLCLLSL
jgi:hypothetical protein